MEQDLLQQWSGTCLVCLLGVLSLDVAWVVLWHFLTPATWGAGPTASWEGPCHRPHSAAAPCALPSATRHEPPSSLPMAATHAGLGDASRGQVVN